MTKSFIRTYLAFFLLWKFEEAASGLEPLNVGEVVATSSFELVAKVPVTYTKDLTRAISARFFLCMRIPIKYIDKFYFNYN